MQSKVNQRACLRIVSLAVVLSCLVAIVAAKPSLSLSFYKNNGYGMGNDINGLFTVNTQVSADVEYVEFYLDGQLQLNDTAAPFSWPFDTNNYTLGLHTIKVVAYDSPGEQTTAERQPNFVEFPIMFVVGIISLVVVGAVVSTVVAMIRAQKQKKNRADTRKPDDRA